MIYTHLFGLVGRARFCSDGLTMSRSADQATLRFYDEEAEQYCRRTGSFPSARLAEFLSRLPSGASILELGCGSGRDAAEMIRLGYDVTPNGRISGDRPQSRSTFESTRQGARIQRSPGKSSIRRRVGTGVSFACTHYSVIRSAHSDLPGLAFAWITLCQLQSRNRRRPRSTRPLLQLSLT